MLTDVTATVPGVGAFFSGTTTTARGYCPATTFSTSNGIQSVTNVFYPDAGVAAPATDRVTATTDGIHILGATVTPVPTFTDLSIVSLNAANPSPSPLFGECPPDGSGLTFTVTPALTSVLPGGCWRTAITGVDVTTDSSTAFVTYTGTGGVLPRYTPTANGPGTLSNIPLSGTATAPVAGVFTTDNTTFYVGTSGDNLVHVITKGANGFADTKTPLVPNVPNINGGSGFATPNLIVQKPRKVTSAAFCPVAVVEGPLLGERAFAGIPSSGIWSKVFISLRLGLNLWPQSIDSVEPYTAKSSKDKGYIFPAKK